ncbi:MAG: IS1182 family transposase [Planctomycetes bacterium]|nr:IS1182 family transposase [Planctomycetota bacterium]
MVIERNGYCNVPGRWKKPPWDEDSPRWLEIEAALAADHLAREIREMVGQLRLDDLFATYAGVGRKAYRPDLMLRVVLYEMRLGHRSPAEWQRHACENSPVRWLAMGIRPSRSRWYDFGDRLTKVIDDLNAQILHLAVERSITTASRSALDGTLIGANSSRHKFLNQQTLERRTAQLQQAIDDEKYGQTLSIVTPGKPVITGPAWMAKTSSGREDQHWRFQAAGVIMCGLHRENAERPAHQRRAAKKIKISIGDPEAPLSIDKEKVFRPLYNVQLAYDLESPLILAYDVFAQPNDNGTLEPMLRRHERLTGCKLEKIFADSTYTSAVDLAACESAGVEMYGPYQENSLSGKKRGKPKYLPKSEFQWMQDEQVYVCPQGHRMGRVGQETRRQSGNRHLKIIQYRCPPQHCCTCPRQTSCTKNPKSGRTVKRNEHEDLVERLRQRMQTIEGMLLYKLRGQTVELGYADFKQHRKLRRFTRRGLQRASTEIGLLVLAHNGLTIVRAVQPQNKAPPNRVTPEEIET